MPVYPGARISILAPGTMPVYMQSGISIIHFPPTQKILLTAAQCNCESSLQCKVLSRATEGAIGGYRENANDPVVRRVLALGPSANRKPINQQNILCFCVGKVRESLY